MTNGWTPLSPVKWPIFVRILVVPQPPPIARSPCDPDHDLAHRSHVRLNGTLCFIRQKEGVLAQQLLIDLLTVG
ncbi:MAG TPA: hypothetical protein VJ761_19750 [Ktedonobacteraceae bacterium]|nr:hypothetical protein [Ktedonobacteraceae bacterium]